MVHWSFIIAAFILGLIVGVTVCLVLTDKEVNR